VDFYVIVEAAAEAVLVVTPRSREEAVRIAFEVGNRHFALAVDAGRVLVPDDPAMEQLMRRLGWSSSGRERSSCRWGSGIAMTDAWLAVLQFADGLFPAGGFAHSFGLETYAQEGAVRDRAGLEAFVAAHLEGSAGPCDRRGRRTAVRLASDRDVTAGWRWTSGWRR